MIIYETVFKKFQAKKIEYVIVGGIAANLLGLIRATADLDILINMRPDNIRKLNTIMKSLGYKLKQTVDITSLDEALLAKLKKEKHLKTLTFHKTTELSEIDIIIDSPITFEQASKHAAIVPVGTLHLPVISLNDLIKMKSAANRDIDKFDIAQLKKIRRLKK